MSLRSWSVSCNTASWVGFEVRASMRNTCRGGARSESRFLGSVELVGGGANIADGIIFDFAVAGVEAYTNKVSAALNISQAEIIGSIIKTHVIRFNSSMLGRRKMRT